MIKTPMEKIHKKDEQSLQRDFLQEKRIKLILQLHGTTTEQNCIFENITYFANWPSIGIIIQISPTGL